MKAIVYTKYGSPDVLELKEVEKPTPRDMDRLFQALLLGPWISMTRKKNIRIVALEPNKDLVYMNELS